MGEQSEDLIHLQVRCDHEAPSVVRGAIDDALEGSELHEDVRLLATELVTNAVRYSGCGPNETIDFRVRLSEDALVISVDDPCVAGQTARLREKPDAAGGFGLRIVDRIARRWGAEHANGQRVWAELAVTS